MRIKGLTRIFSGSRASDTRGQASLPPRRRTPRPQPPVVSVFRRGGRRCGRLPTANRNLTAPNGNLTASKRGNCTIRGARTSSPHVESATKRENCTTRGSRSGLPADDTASKRGNCTIRAATRRRHAEERLLMVQNPHVSPKCTAGMEGVGGTGSRGQASRHGPDRGARWAAVA